MNERMSIIEYKGHKIYVSDMSDLSGEAYLQVIQEAIERDANLSEGSLILQDITGSVVDQHVKDVVKENTAVMRQKNFKIAMLGVTGFKRVIANLLNPEAYFAQSQEDALEWLTRDE